MALKPLPGVLVAIALAVVTIDARAQVLCSPGPAFGRAPAGDCGNGGCATPCDALLGEFAYLGAGVFPQGIGISMAGGLLYQYPVGVEAALHLPATTGPVTRPFFLGALYARIRLLREGLSSPWEHGAPVPAAAFLLALRVGPGLAVGPSQPLGLAIGPSADFIFGGLLLVGIRPAILVMPGPREGRSILGLEVLPMFDLSLGAVPPGALAN